MKTNFTLARIFTCLLFFNLLLCFNTTQAQCINADFSQGNFTGWSGAWSNGVCTGGYTLGICMGCLYPMPTQYTGINRGPDNGGPLDTNYVHHIMTSAAGNDANLSQDGVVLPAVFPGGSGYSACMGNLRQATSPDMDPEASTLSYSFLVTPQNALFIYHYAVVLYDGGHPAGQQAYFKIRMFDGNGDSIACASYDVDATTAYTIGGFSVISNSHVSNGPVLYKPWTTVNTPLSNYIGQTITLTFTTSGCQPSGCGGSHDAYAFVSAECSVPTLHISAFGSCVHPSDSLTLTAPVGAATYSWTGPGVVSGGTSRSAIINQPGHYTVTMTTYGNVPCTFTLDTTISANFNSLQANFSASNTCAGTAAAFTDLSSPQNYISSWAWDFNNDGVTDDTTANPSHTFAAAGTYPVKLSVTSPGCSADTTINVVVITSPTSTFTATDPVCAGENSTFTFTGVADNNAVFTWNFGNGNASSLTGPGPITVVWDSTGTIHASLTVSQYDCFSTVADTITVQTCTGILPINANDISIYPNPAKNDFTIELNTAIQNGKIEMYDVLGRRLYLDEIRNAPTGFSKHIQLNVAAGVYLLSIVDGEKIYSRKVVID